MAKAPEKVAVFIDTQVFIRYNHNYTHRHFDALATLAKEGHIQVILTTVTVGEVEAHIDEDLDVAHQCLRHVSKDCRIIDAIGGYRALASDSGLKEMKAQVHGAFDAFCTEADATIIATYKVNAEEIFEAYFGWEPPFHEGRKRTEFPDAFAAAALRRWCQEQKCTCYVVSGDHGWQFMCENDPHLKYLSELTKVLELFQDDVLAARIRNAAEENRASLIVSISEAFQDLTFMPAEVDGEVDAVHDVDITFDEVQVTSAKDGVATINIDCTIDFQAEVNYTVPGSGMWDSEDHVMLFEESASGTVERKVDRSVEVEVTYDENVPPHLEIKNVTFYPSDEVWVEVDEEGM